MMKYCDYIIVGGGSAGSIVAARLSENPDITVCLLEAGPDDDNKSEILQLDRWMDLLESTYDWDYPVQPQLRGNSFLRHSRAKILGGCSSHNSCIAFHPPQEGLDQWEQIGLQGWSAKDFLPYTYKVTSGCVPLRDVPAKDPCGRALLESAQVLGIPTVQFNRGYTIKDGAGWFQINATDEGIRLSSSYAYLHPIRKNRPNLTILTDTQVTEILFSGICANGVRYCSFGERAQQEIYAHKEVIICAGAIDTPKLLLLSGIGPKDHLLAMGIPVRKDLPGVGENFDDHVEGLVMFEARQLMVDTSTQWWEIGIFTTIDSTSPVPDLMLHYGCVPFDINTVRHGFPTSDNAFCLTPNVTQGKSRGTVRLASRDYRDRPLVDPKYFTDSEGYDEKIMLAGIKLARKLGQQEPLHSWVARELAPGPDIYSDEEIIDYFLKTHNTVYHPAGTAKMGIDTDPLAVLDPQLCVRGIKNLRVVDASAMPFLPAVNPNITIMAMAEKAADLICGK